ncbi:pyruvate, phosphate dikinase [Haloechinothrix sp. YIM 98757]|uniref:Pyruvate, phosphate dikinase n=1 Tax=Haloechinothrix aidingensis TaxID=2752311 RepID=A0A838ABG3_9PSEU|nr:pyruvate, phosphate dikinase [Haloechinothrix aidingensis]MBA0126545.1 pyruvate, phosphate dikinase [Haloechinothrix aidingensis]
MTTTDPTGTRPAVAWLDGTCLLPREAIGGKAWSLNRMRALGLPAPPAFTVTTACCAEYVAAGRRLPGWLDEKVREGIRFLEADTGRRFGGAERPLLVSVRSGAAVSMPGMMDTVLDLGINATVERVLAGEVGSAHYAHDTHRRFVEQYREIVLGDPGGAVPEDPWEQLWAAIAAVFDSWESPRARAYRRNRGIDDTSGTSVTVQAMVFGNRDGRSGTGVLFSRDPSTGEGPVWGEWLVGGQGEDVVAGRVTPEPLTALAESQPEVYARLLAAAEELERDGRDIQDIEFTVESGTLWLLQARSAKRTPRAAVRSAVAMAGEGLIGETEALRRVSAEQLRLLLEPELSDRHAGSALASGEAACQGLASGQVVTDPDEAEKRADDGDDVILVRSTTSPEDFHGMLAARAVVTELGGATSHAAVVSREIGRPCVVGCGAGTVDGLAGRDVTVDGATGVVWAGTHAGDAIDETTMPDVLRIGEWAARKAPLAVYRASTFDPAQVGGYEPADLDDAGEQWRPALRAARGARGAVLETDEGVHAAVEAGLEFIVVEHAAPALLSAVECVTGQERGSG